MRDLVSGSIDGFASAPAKDVGYASMALFMGLCHWSYALMIDIQSR